MYSTSFDFLKHGQVHLLICHLVTGAKLRLGAEVEVGVVEAVEEVVVVVVGDSVEEVVLGVAEGDLQEVDVVVVVEVVLEAEEDFS